MWSEHRRGPPPFYDPPATGPAAGSLYPNPYAVDSPAGYRPPEPPAGSVPVISHRGVPSPIAGGYQQPTAPPPVGAQQPFQLPPQYGFQPPFQQVPPAGAAPGYHANPYLPNQSTGEDVWMTVKHGDPFPYGAVQAMDRDLKNNDKSTHQSYVALWNHGGEPVFGRARKDKHGRVEAWFPYGGKEHHSNGMSNFSILLTNQPGHNFRYAWVQMNQLNDMCRPVKQQNYSPVVVQDVHCRDSFHGELLGKGDTSRRMVWVSYSGKEHHFDGRHFENAYVLCRVPL